MIDLAGWVALAATCIAAVMTASNLGARVTGWGFVIFTIGAAGWIVVGASTHQPQLLYSNIFLAVVDLLGVWRWLGRRAKISDAAEAEVRRSKQRDGDDLFSLGSVEGWPVLSQDGAVMAHAVDVLASCGSGHIDYIVIRTGGVGGVGETLRRLPWSEAHIADKAVKTRLDAAAVDRLPQTAD
ncbi:PRC-barrel domain-containing protein [Sphingomonas sp. 3P27F8]|uniref:PRC-barrel domain-containing protein n=1 Tax=Sphingomonas sp. 3P27F8 TaxID=2502213 RepID=UPI0010F99616|nr:PRC-barrel domain-containing protein [Sphingomonas sp. 3P27F8]